MSDKDKSDRVDVLAKAVAFAMYTHQYPISMPAVRQIAELLDDCGVRQTDEKATEITLPGVMLERLREGSTEVPDPIDLSTPQETPRVRKAPKRPKRIPKDRMGVVG
ncbi:hypothetical protein [Gordonia sp. ABSL49_1]|uniref:hypothetical protein n=1 Tax=Gordonia sp. ABSL49_1 TaxID=2920941 RepID=UPI001F0F5034|nr:hypothetical protein [Gordonia sp. ABSL49_1]MCH5645172.1 hypothetical protein [Gordonia sp. ABSL49_1]